MPDIYEYVGDDIQTSPTGDLASVSGTILGQQRVLRRLVTKPGSYIWHPDYGAGLGQFIGKPETSAQIQGLVLSQMLLEACVAQTPPPTVSVSFTPSGLFTVNIGYVDAQTGTPVTLEFDIGN